MAKEPQPNMVKTRLIPDFSPVIASKIYHGFLMDRIDQVSEIPEVDYYIAYTPNSAENYFNNFASRNFVLIPQKGIDLGERLSNISSELFNKGYEKIVIMDSDSPNLPTQLIISSLIHLNEVDIVLGPCEDGGYYLVGLGRHVPEIFMDIPWSTPSVTETTMRKAESAGRSISLLKKWYDVDTKKDLIRLKNDLDRYFQGPQGMYFCKYTHNIISEIDIMNNIEDPQKKEK
jgi:rSAM/selenodomain-associated transferase 1